MTEFKTIMCRAFDAITNRLGTPVIIRSASGGYVCCDGVFDGRPAQSFSGDAVMHDNACSVRVKTSALDRLEIAINDTVEIGEKTYTVLATDEYPSSGLTDIIMRGQL